MPTYLTLASNAQRVAPITGVTPAQSRVRQTLGGLNQAYKALTMTQKGGWQTVANTLNARQKRTGKHKLHPSNAYVTLNSARLACGLPALADAPADLTAPPLLPAITVQTTAPDAKTNADTPFTLQLLSPGYPHAVQILAAPPTPIGKPTFPDSAFRLIGSLPSLAPGDDIAALYQAAYGTPEPGSQLALKLVATAPSGLRLTPLVLLGIVTATPQPAPSGFVSLDTEFIPGQFPARNFSPPPIRSQSTPGIITPGIITPAHSHANHSPPT